MVSRRGRQRVGGGGKEESGSVVVAAAAEKGEEGQEYEKLRGQRIKENKERMIKLGILDLSLQLLNKSPTLSPSPANDTPHKKKKLKKIKEDDPSSPPRRSSRLKVMSPVNYSEMHSKRKRGSPKKVEVRIPEGTQPEVYTEEHAKLLGDCKTPWTLYVDGYGNDGKRIYDQENGETCHQCRQKTLGLHTHCNKCNLVQGQFCGDCLYMRYGENVVEVNQNPDWVCPVCRGICNCSLCRKARGWAPTGALYRKIISMGFKSVAHYLIQTCHSHTHSDNLGADCLVLEDQAMPTQEESPRPFTKQKPLDTIEDLDNEMDQERLVLCSDNGKFVNISNQGGESNGISTVNYDSGSKGMKESIGSLEPTN